MAVHGALNIYIPPDPRPPPYFDNPYQGSSYYTGSILLYSAVKNLLITKGPLVGVSLIASGTTSGATYVGQWSLFQFASASLPFYVCLQVVTGGQIGSSPFGANGITELNGGAYAAGGFGVSIAACDNGASPWNNYSSPFWTDVSGNLFVWPRSNHIGGAYASSRKNFMLLSDAISVAYSGVSAHALIDQDQFMLLTDTASDSNYSGFYFGKIKTNPGSALAYPSGAYVALNTYADGTHPLFITYATLSNPSRLYGTIAGNGSYEGGVMMPTGSKPGVTDYLSQPPMGVKTAIIDLPKILFYRGGYENSVSPFFPNTCYNTRSFDLISPSIISYDHPGARGFVGQVTFFQYTMNVATHDTNQNKTLAVFGNSVIADEKIVVPWDGVTTPTTGTGSLTGTLF